MIKPLTSLRFLFAIMVFLTHMNFLFYKNDPGFIALYNNLFYEGYIGVGFFFMLSGFILSYTYKKSLLEETITRKEYFFKRLARIYPLHLFTLYLSIPIILIELGKHTPIFTKQFFANIFLLQSFGPDRGYFFSFNSLSWSISDELFFYLCFPFLILLFFHYKYIARIILLVACITIPFCMPHVDKGVPEHTIFYINPFVRLVDFTIGIFLFDLFTMIKKKQWKFNGTVLECIAVAVFIVFLYFHNDIPQADRYSCYYWIPIAFVILTFAFQSGKISVILSNKALVFLGEISFGFYMFHQLVIRYYTQLDVDFHLTNNPYVAMFTVFVVAVIISAFGYFSIEKPANKFIINKIISRSKKKENKI